MFIKAQDFKNNQISFSDSLFIHQQIDSAQLYSNSNQKKARAFILRAKEVSQKTKYIRGLAQFYRIDGLIDFYQVAYTSSLEKELMALKLFQAIDDKRMIARCYNFIGLIYGQQGYYNQAKNYYDKALEIRIILNDSIGIAGSYNNTGVLYNKMNKKNEALNYFRKALTYIENSQEKASISMYLENIGRIYIDWNMPDSAIVYFEKSFQIRQKTNDLQGLANIYTSFGNYYLLKNNCIKAIENYKKGLKYSKQIAIIYEAESAVEGLYKAYAKCNNFKEAYNALLYFIELNDSANKDEISKKINQLELESSFEKERSFTKMQNEKKELEQKVLIKKEETLRNYVVLGLVAAMIILFLLWKSFKRKQKDNKLLTEQKNEILQYLNDIQQRNEEIIAQRDEIESQNNHLSEAFNIIEKKNKNITDSIRYAQRIQQSILPPEELISKLIPNSFILYLPKSIVSGDFYWLDFKQNYIFIAAVDCTGHGVPGAFMSIVGYNLLNQALNELNLLKSSEILDYLSTNVTKTLRQNDADNNLRDGMDIALCRIDLLTLKMEISAALNPIYIIRDKELIEFKGDKWQIGKPFTSNFTGYKCLEFQLQKNDFIYLFSDGFIDQFNGETGKKFSSNQFKDELLQASHLPIRKQKEVLEKKFYNWKKNSEQIDDVMVIGIKI